MTTTFFVRSVPTELHRQIKADAAANGLTLAQWLAVALEARRNEAAAILVLGKQARDSDPVDALRRFENRFPT